MMNPLIYYSRLVTRCSLLFLLATTAHAAEYWVSPDGDDRADGTSREQAWASPSRGQPSRVREGYKTGDRQLPVLSTEGFPDAGRLVIAGEERAYTGRTADAFELAEPFTRDLAALEPVHDATILGGDSFEPGDVIQLAGGTYVDRPLNFCASGSAGSPITYRSAPGERAVLVSQAYNVSPIKRLGSWRKDNTQHVVFEGLRLENHAEGNHGAPGMSLYGVAHIRVVDCDIDISGRDINGDNNGISIFGASNVVVERCRIRSRQANGVMVWQASDIHVRHSVIYESFNGIQVAGGRFPAKVDVSQCTIYAINTYAAANAEPGGTIQVDHCIIVQMPTMWTPALRGSGTGDFNCLWHVPAIYGPGWNDSDSGAPGEHDIVGDPQFISLDPGNPRFLNIPGSSPAARAGKDGTHMGAFAPVAWPKQPKSKDFNVRDFGATGDGTTDDLPAIRKAIAQAVEAGAGRVIFPASKQPYLVSDTIVIEADHVQLIGPGATLKLKPGAGRMDLLQIGVRINGMRNGPVPPGIEHVTVEGFTLDGSYRSQLQKRVGNNPRGIWIGKARHVTIKNVTIRDTFCGLTFGPGARQGQAIDVTVTDWDHDGFGASGRGLSGSCTDIRFIRCRAVDTPKCVKAWEIEEGAHGVILEDCLVENLGGTGTGFYVRHHEYLWPVLVHDVVFRRCRVRKISGQGFILTTVPGTGPRAVRPKVETHKVRLFDCESDAPVTIACGIDDVVIEGGRFTNLMAIGFDAMTPGEDRGPRWPARSVTLRDSTIGRLKINARTGNPNAKLGDEHWPDYEPRVELVNVAARQPLDIVGNKHNVRLTQSISEVRKPMLGQTDDGQLHLVTDGEATSTIVVADDADWWHRMAAGWLQDYVQRATGAALPIVRESDAPQGPLISVGHTKRAADAGIQTDDLQWDGCRLAVRDDVVFLLGRDGEGPGRGDPTPEKVKDWTEGDPWRPDRIGSAKGADLAGANGTCKAVVTFLEDVCGVRWFMPVEQGIVVPRSNNVAVPRTLNKVVRPVFAYANGSFLYGTPRLYPSAYANNFRFGIRLKTYGGHSWNSWVHASLFKEHPEYFALRDGKRTAEGNHVCTTNPKVRDRMLRELRELFDKGYDWVQIGQSDGWKHCECDSCEAMDNFKPYDPEVNGPDWWKWLLSVSRENPVERIHLLHNWVAEQAAISHPDKKVHYLAYIPTRWPSKQIDQYSPNVVAELCHEIPEMLDAWSDKVPAMTIYRIWWDMSWVYGYGPDPTPKEVADEIRNLRDYGVIGIFNGGEGNCWGLNGPVFYVMGKTIGDPDLDENDLVNEYCHGVYGEAGEQMNAFFQHLYRGPARINKQLPEAPHAESLRARFPPRVIAELEDLLGKAEAVGVSGHAADNLRMTRIALDYLRLTTHMWGAYEAFEMARTSASLAELRKHVDAFEDFRHMILHMDPDDAERRFPDWGHFCKWLTGSHYWDSWHHVRETVDLSAIRGKPVGFYAKIRKPLTLDFDALEVQMNRGDETGAASFKDEAEAWEAKALEVALRVETDLDD